jgi:hypothetical protein
MKVSGKWEEPFEGAVRELNEEVTYWDSEIQQWRTFDMQLLENYTAYLECVFKHRKAGYRRIGLFVVCLQHDLQVRCKDHTEVDHTEVDVCTQNCVQICS